MTDGKRWVWGWVLPALMALPAACNSAPNAATNVAAPEAEMTPVAVQDLDIVSGQTIYVPAYSLAVHNTDLTRPIVLTSVRYYSSDGQLVREYLPEPRQLGPLASTGFVVDPVRGAGVGTNFIVEWVAEEPVYEPVVEALMLNATGNQGVSFVSVGRVISQIE